MQLNPSSGSDYQMTAGAVRTSLAAATWALLSAMPGPLPAAQIEGATLVYTEPNRVSAVETVVEATKESEDGQVLGLRFAIDALTGASANGAVPSNRIQTFTRPSGQGSYSIKPGKTPLDPTFRDTRYAGSGTWVRPLGPFTRSNLGLNISTEADYFSVGLSGGIAQDLAMRNTNLAAGFSFSRDTVKPRAGAPIAFSAMSPASGEHHGDDEEEGGGGGPGKRKMVADFLVGLTQVLDRATLARLNYTFGLSSGYLTDPYKLLSVVEARDGARPGDPVEYLYEKRPPRRAKQSIYAELHRRIGPDVAQASYRFYWDSWLVRSSTWDLHLAQPLGERTSLEPHVRYYQQRRADFYTSYLVSGRSLPSHASADYRLGTFHATTVGMEAKRSLDSGPTLRLGVEYYLQRGDKSPPGAFGALASQDLFPDVSAWMIRAGASMPIHW